MNGRSYRSLTAADAAGAAPVGWRVDGTVLTARYRTASMTRGLTLIERVVEAAESADHHPDIDFRYGTVGFVLTTHATGGLTDADVDLAEAIALLAADLGVEPDVSPEPESGQPRTNG